MLLRCSWLVAPLATAALVLPVPATADDPATERPAAPGDATAICPVLVGSTAPAATVLDMQGESVELQSVLADEPTVLVFFRGGW